MTMETDKSQLSLTLLFDSLPIIDPQQLAKSIASIESIDTEIVVDVTVQLSNYLCASIEFGSHRLKLTGFPVPIPTHQRDMAIEFSDLSPAEKAAIDKHSSYIICDYEGDDTSLVEQLISLYKAAYGFHDRGLLGVLDLGAWSCITPKMLKDLLSKKMLRSHRSSKPMYLATGLVKIPKDDGNIWFCTKGFHRFNSQDYAYLGIASEEEFIRGIFEGFFDGIDFICGGRFECGNQVVFGDDEGIATTLINTREVYEYFDYLSSPSGTYVLESTTIDPSVDKILQSNNLSSSAGG
jgi:hypothetical protein